MSDLNRYYVKLKLTYEYEGYSHFIRTGRRDFQKKI